MGHTECDYGSVATRRWRVTAAPASGCRRNAPIVPPSATMASRTNATAYGGVAVAGPGMMPLSAGLQRVGVADLVGGGVCEGDRGVAGETHRAADPVEHRHHRDHHQRRAG